MFISVKPRRSPVGSSRLRDEFEDDVRDEYESSRWCLKGRGSHQLIEWASHDGVSTDSIINVIDSHSCPGERLYGDNEPTLGGRSSIEGDEGRSSNLDGIRIRPVSSCHTSQDTNCP